MQRSGHLARASTPNSPWWGRSRPVDTSLVRPSWAVPKDYPSPGTADGLSFRSSDVTVTELTGLEGTS